LNPVEAQQVCQSAEQALRHGSIHLHQFPGLLKRVIEERLWERRRVPGLGVVELPSLRDLVTAKPLKGWGQDPTMIEAVIRDDAEVLTMWRTAIKAPGLRTDLGNNVTEVKPRLKGNSRAYTLDRLKRERPDLFDQVKGRKLSAHRAAVIAGFHRDKTPLEHIQHWWAKTSPDERLAFLRWARTDQ